MKITSKGQVTIPQEIRDRYGLHPDTQVEFAPGDGGVTIRPAPNTKLQFREWIAKAKGSAPVKVTTDEAQQLTRGED